MYLPKIKDIKTMNIFLNHLRIKERRNYNLIKYYFYSIKKKIEIIQQINFQFKEELQKFYLIKEVEIQVKEEKEEKKKFQYLLENKNNETSLIQKFKEKIHLILSLFLPKDYPNSIEKGYSNYAIYQTIGFIFSTAGSVLSTQALLYSLGLNEGSLPLAVTLNWIIKDGLGQFGGIIFGSLINNQFDQNPKKWRLISSILIDLSAFIELLTPLYPKYFILFASIANIGKNISYLSASASRVAIHKSFIIYENLGDVTVKTGSQMTLGSLLGTTFGIFLSTMINNSYIMSIYCFIFCSFFHQLFNFHSLRYVTIKTLNLPTLEIIFYNYYQFFQLQNENNNNEKNKNFHILTPKEININYNFISSFYNQIKNIYNKNNQRNELISLYIGEDFSKVFQSSINYEVSFKFLLFSILTFLPIFLLLI